MFLFISMYPKMYPISLYDIFTKVWNLPLPRGCSTATGPWGSGGMRRSGDVRWCARNFLISTSLRPWPRERRSAFPTTCSEERPRSEISISIFFSRGCPWMTSRSERKGINDFVTTILSKALVIKSMTMGEWFKNCSKLRDDH